MSDFHIVVTSDTTRDELFAELWAGDEQWGEVIFNSFDITIFPPRAGGKYVFGLASVQASLQEAQ